MAHQIDHRMVAQALLAYQTDRRRAALMVLRFSLRQKYRQHWARPVHRLLRQVPLEQQQLLRAAMALVQLYLVQAGPVVRFAEPNLFRPYQKGYCQVLALAWLLLKADRWR
jgi:hypothetical protein